MEVEVMKKPLVSGIRIHCILGCLVVAFAIAPAQVSAQTPAASLANTPNPELVGMLTKELNITPRRPRAGRGPFLARPKAG
jgi:hypothetical protein